MKKLRELLREESELFLALGINVLWAAGIVGLIYLFRWLGLL